MSSWVLIGLIAFLIVDIALIALLLRRGRSGRLAREEERPAGTPERVDASRVAGATAHPMEPGSGSAEELQTPAPYPPLGPRPTIRIPQDGAGTTNGEAAEAQADQRAHLWERAAALEEELRQLRTQLMASERSPEAPQKSERR